MPRKAKTETTVTENVELKEEQIQTPEAPGPMEAASKETSPEAEENPDKLEDAGKSDGIAATESSEAGAADEHHSDPGMIPTIEQDTASDEKEPTPPAKAASPEQTEENIQRPVPARNRPASPAPARRQASPSILTLNADSEVETQESREDIIWHELQNAYRTRKILTGNLGGIERMEGGGTIAVIYYKEMRVVIPLAEMMINLAEDESHDYGELVLRQNKILGNMLGCEIDFIVKGLDNSSRSVVASRKDAMYKKRQIFYLPDAAGNSRVCEDRIVQARVIAVAEKVVRVEIFGTECSILARDLSWDWMGDATECFHVGDQILVRILSVKIRSLEDISVRADVKSVNGNTSKANLGKCKIQGKYAGTVTDIHKGTVFVRLQIGVNAIAHSCYDSRMPGKKDDVSFVVTRIDEERNVAVGLISRIIRQNI
ncbi:S1 RNA-binding domain-containing protein [Lachnospiraceae bacterium 38-10]